MFAPLTPDDYFRLLPYFDPQVHRLCYYSLSAFICWRHHVSHPVWAIHDDMLLIGMRHARNVQDDYLYLPLAKGRVFPPEVLRDLAREHGFARYRFVPGDFVETLDAEALDHCFDCIDDPDLADYLYNSEDLAHLKGNRYSKKRNLINQFLKSHVDKGQVTVLPMTAEDTPECLDFLWSWSHTRQIDPTAEDWGAMEMKAAANAIKTIDMLGYSGLILRIDGTIKAFGICSTLTDELAGFHFEKADPDIKGLYQYFDQQCARRLLAGRPLVNKECDMGEPGLRQSKRSYHPVAFVQAFELRVKHA